MLNDRHAKYSFTANKMKQQQFVLVGGDLFHLSLIIDLLTARVAKSNYDD